MKGRFLAVTFLITVSSLAQEKNKRCDCKFQSINNIGLMEGGRGASFQLQTINGLAVENWFIGLGAGIDYYRFRSVPLFLDVRREFLKKNIRPFLYGSAGIHIPWKRDDETFYMNSELSGGLFYDVGLGFNVTSVKNNGFLISAGYSYKRINESVRTSPYCLVGPCPEYEQNREYGLKRLSMKVGWRFRSV